MKPKSITLKGSQLAGINAAMKSGGDVHSEVQNATHEFERPYQRSRDIRSGKVDGGMPSYEELTGWLQRIPETWLPSLLMRISMHCSIAKTFTSKDAQIEACAKSYDSGQNRERELRAAIDTAKAAAIAAEGT